MNVPENDWTQCQNPEGIQDALMKKRQISTGQTRKIINKKIR